MTPLPCLSRCYLWELLFSCSPTVDVLKTRMTLNASLCIILCVLTVIVCYSVHLASDSVLYCVCPYSDCVLYCVSLQWLCVPFVVMSPATSGVSNTTHLNTTSYPPWLGAWEEDSILVKVDSFLFMVSCRNKLLPLRASV